MRIAEVMQEIRKSNEEHGFKADGRDLFCEKMVLVHTEISEAVEEFRKGRGLTEVYYEDSPKPEGIPIEIADAIIRLLDFCAANDIDLENAIRIKMDFNKTRPFRHGKKI